MGPFCVQEWAKIWIKKIFYLKATGQQCRKTWQQQKFSLCLSLSKGGKSIPVHQGRDQDSKYYSNAGDIQKQETLWISFEIKSDRLDQWLHKWWTKWGQRSIQTRIWGTALLVECKNCILLNCFIFWDLPLCQKVRGHVALQPLSGFVPERKMFEYIWLQSQQLARDD